MGVARQRRKVAVVADSTRVDGTEPGFQIEVFLSSERKQSRLASPLYLRQYFSNPGRAHCRGKLALSLSPFLSIFKFLAHS